MGRRVDIGSKRKRSESVYSYWYIPEARWSNNEQVDWEARRTEPVSVAKLWDDLLLGVKGLSNLVIAGSPRNLSK